MRGRMAGSVLLLQVRQSERGHRVLEEPTATAASTPHRLGTGSADTLGAAKPNLSGASRGWQPHTNHLEVRLHLEVIEEDPH